MAAGLLTAIVGLVNVASALTPDIRWRGHLLLRMDGVQAIELFHALALPVGAALLLVGPYLFRRRHRAMQVAIVLLVAIGVIDLLKGLDFEKSMIAWLVVALLCWRRDDFSVAHEPVTLRSAVWRVPLLGLAVLAVVIAGGHAAELPWMPRAIQLVELSTLLGIAYLLFRPLAVPKAWPTAAVRYRATQLVRQHGHDTLSFFKLRPDKLYFFNSDRSAFVGYRVEAGTLLLSGDPVGPVEAFPEMLAELRRFARSRGLRLAALAVSERLASMYEAAGLQTLYLGDEAVVEVENFSLEGRAIRKVRQSVNRLRKAGYSSELCGLHEIDPETMEQMRHVLSVGRIGGAERGFAMGMDGIHGALEQDTLFMLARDGGGHLRGVLHFVPCYGRSAMSLSIMRRDPESPNGLMEFLVVAAIEQMRERGIREVSLNFATFTKYLHSPEGWFEHLVALVAHRMDSFMQMESLYRFNVKFQPRWDARYLVYEGRLGVARAGLAALWAEGQIPKPRLPRLQA